MNPSPPITPPASPGLPPQAHTFLCARLAEQSALLQSLEAKSASLRSELSRLRQQHPTIEAKTNIMDIRSFGRTAKARIDGELEQVGRDFDSQIGESSNGGLVKEKVLEKVRQGTGQILIVRIAIAQLEFLCARFEVKAKFEEKDGVAGKEGLEAFGEVFEKGSHDDEEYFGDDERGRG